MLIMPYAVTDSPKSYQEPVYVPGFQFRMVGSYAKPFILSCVKPKTLVSPFTLQA